MMLVRIHPLVTTSLSGNGVLCSKKQGFVIVLDRQSQSIKQLISRFAPTKHKNPASVSFHVRQLEVHVQRAWGRVLAHPGYNSLHVPLWQAVQWEPSGRKRNNGCMLWIPPPLPIHICTPFPSAIIPLCVILSLPSLFLFRRRH